MKSPQLKHNYQLKTQRGNTLLGIIIGLVIGLSIAVGVALVINKSSTPFTNKGKNDKAELTAPQLQDPNKPLYGSKDAVKEAAKEVAKTAEAKQAADAHPPVAPTKDSKPSEAIIPPIAQAPAQTTAPAADAIDDKYIYFLQAGAFREPAEAESTRAKLALLGFEARVSEKQTDGGVLHRVRIGPFNQLDTTNRVRGKLSENGVEAAIVRTTK